MNKNCFFSLNFLCILRRESARIDSVHGLCVKVSFMDKRSVSKRVIFLELLGFLAIIALIWIDQVFDIPHRFLGAPATLVNWKESILESIVIVLIGGRIVHHTHLLFQRMRYLEGMLPVCASCKKIRIGTDDWQQIETYIRDRSEAEFSHSLCPDCAAELYPEYYSQKADSGEKK